MSARNERDIANRRSSDRIAVVLGVECLLDPERRSDVWLIDLSASGCQLFASSGLFQASQEIVLLRATGESHRGRVAWTDGMKAGVMFDLALSNAALGSLLETPVASPSPAPVFDRLTDRFGRDLAPLPALRRRALRG
jgi:hypothetical protein